MGGVNTKVRKRCHAKKLRGCPKNFSPKIFQQTWWVAFDKNIQQ